jgi:hypothetical protein
MGATAFLDIGIKMVSEAQAERWRAHGWKEPSYLDSGNFLGPFLT